MLLCGLAFDATRGALSSPGFLPLLGRLLLAWLENIVGEVKVPAMLDRDRRQVLQVFGVLRPTLTQASELVSFVCEIQLLGILDSVSKTHASLREYDKDRETKDPWIHATAELLFSCCSPFASSSPM